MRANDRNEYKERERATRIEPARGRTSADVDGVMLTVA